MPRLLEGQKAPDFQLLDDAGARFHLETCLKEGPVVLFFYPKDETAVCTREACGFRDQYTAFTTGGGQVFGISRDDQASHAAFRAHHHLPFRLLSDPGGRVADLFGVTRTLGILPGRATFVITRDQVLALSFQSALSASAHIENARRVIATLHRER